LPSLKRRSEFQLLRDTGQFAHITHWLAISYKCNKEEQLRWGWTLSKKIGNAVTRNKLKRWGRDVLCEFKEKDIDINFIFKNKTKEFYKKLSREDFNKALTKVFKNQPKKTGN